MDADLFTLILTRGAHSITREAALEIRRAIEAGDLIVDVELDPFGGGETMRRTAVVTAHVMAIAEPRPVEAAPEYGPNVHPLHRKTGGV